MENNSRDPQGSQGTRGVSLRRNKIDWAFLIFILLVAGVLAYMYPERTRGLWNLLKKKVVPCQSPITYSIGEVDPRFKISDKKIIENLKEAEDIWEKSTLPGNYFEYKEKGGDVTVNLVYDSRQDATNKLVELGIQTDNTRESYDALKKRYDALRVQVDAQKADYVNKVAVYRQAEKDYGAEVEKWNKQGGAPRSEYEHLQAEKTALANQFANLKATEAEMNRNVETLNALATRINQLISQLNIHVDQYNQTGASVGEFEEGLYEYKGGIETINIFEYRDHTSLVRVLAHELGHSLNLEHVSDAEAIMYQTNKGKGLKATQADVEELGKVCRVQ